MSNEAAANVPVLIGRYAIVYGAESDVGRAVAAALRDAGAVVGVTSATTDGTALFALKRAAGGGAAEAVDLGNAASARVATRKLAKAIGRIDVAVLLPPAELADAALDALLDLVARELSRAAEPRLVLVTPPAASGFPAGVREVPLKQIAAGAPRETAVAIVSLVSS